MTKHVFLKRLKFALRGGFNRRESRDVISDYEGFFEQGSANGVSEDAVAAGLGDPVSVAFSIARESGKFPPAGAVMLKHRDLIRSLLGAAVIGFTVFIFRTAVMYPFDIDAHVMGVLSLISTSIGLFLILRPKIGAVNFECGLKGFVVSNAVMLALGIFCCIFFSSQASVDFALWAVEQYPEHYFLGMFINGVSQIHLFSIIIAASIGLYSALAVWRGKTEGFATVIHSLSLCVYLQTVNNIWGTLDATDTYVNAMGLITVIYAAGIIFTVLAGVYLANRKGARI